VRKCRDKELRIGYYPFIKEEADNNLTYAVNSLLGARRVPYYQRKNLVDKAWDAIHKLFNEELEELKEKCTDREIKDAWRFFKTNEKNLKRELNLQYEKSNIPENTDLKLMVCINNENWRNGYLLTDDAHFTGYMDEINKSVYSVVVIPMKELRQIMLKWGWS